MSYIVGWNDIDVHRLKADIDLNMNDFREKIYETYKADLRRVWVEGEATSMGFFFNHEEDYLMFVARYAI